MRVDDLSAVRAAAIDGRASNIFYRLTQLEKLHKALIEYSADIQEAIVADCGYTAAEAKVEYCLALQVLRSKHQSLDGPTALENEYRIAKNRDANDTRVPVGLVVIKPALYNLFFSVIAPLSASIAAGNCSILQLPNTTRVLPKVLGAVFKGSLDPDSIAIASGSIPEDVMKQVGLEVIQDQVLTHPTLSSQIVSTRSRTIAVVDRSADFDEAAKALVTARFSFCGRGSFGPDLVIVNEFAKQDLVQAILKHKAALYGNTVRVELTERALKGFVADYSRKEHVRLISQDASGAVLDVINRSDTFMDGKVEQPCLIIHSMRSLDDAIDLLYSDGPYAAAYLFGNPSTGKYLSQYINSQVAFVNNIPTSILVGPTFPRYQAVNPFDKYPTELFSRSAPAYINPMASSVTLCSALTTSHSRTETEQLLKLYQAAVSELSARKQRKQIRASFGYFEQAFLLHFGSAALMILGGIATGAWYLRNNGWPRFK